MQTQPKATALGWLGVFGLVVTLAMSACESDTVNPVPAKTQPTGHVASDDDGLPGPPDRPTKPPGGG